MVIGWDIGGVNAKVARVSEARVLAVRGRPFELQRAPDALVPLLRDLADDVGIEPGDAHALTMTAELSQMFRTKREGVAFVVGALEAAFLGARIRIFTVDGTFVQPDDARRDPLAAAAANWAATARVVAWHHTDALLIDVGTTTTDIIPIAGGSVVARGRTDPERLASGELVYTGALRTPIEAIASHVPLNGSLAGVSAEGFALAGDVHVWRGDLPSSDYTVPTPDGRPATREFAGERLARVVCGDREILDDAAITAIADALAQAQVTRIAGAIGHVIARNPVRTAVVTGLGAFLGGAAARAAGLRIIPLATELGDDASRCAPAACVALLLERELSPLTVVKSGGVGVGRALTARLSDTARLGEAPRKGAPHGLLVIKVGGSLLAHEQQFDAALTAIGEMARERRVAVVPGGGPFADAVRDVDRRVGLSGDAAHWMAILAMDQYAHLIVERMTNAVVVTTASAAMAAVASRRIPVFAPSTWLREVDPLPHTWDVTSDSIAAWIAGQLHAEQLILIKPPGANGAAAIDPYFPHAAPAGLPVTIAPVDQLVQHLSLI